MAAIRFCGRRCARLFGCFEATAAFETVRKFADFIYKGTSRRNPS